MTLLVGGAGQGKLSWALEHTGLTMEAVSDSPCQPKPIVTGLETFLKTEKDPWPALKGLLEAYPKALLLCDEVGCGVVPVDPEERAWRERVGRCCCELAQQADCVLRLYCGIASVLKGEWEWN